MRVRVFFGLIAADTVLQVCLVNFVSIDAWGISLVASSLAGMPLAWWAAQE